MQIKDSHLGFESFTAIASVSLLSERIPWLKLPQEISTSIWHYSNLPV